MIFTIKKKKVKVFHFTWLEDWVGEAMERKRGRRRQRLRVGEKEEWQNGNKREEDNLVKLTFKKGENRGGE